MYIIAEIGCLSSSFKLQINSIMSETVLETYHIQMKGDPSKGIVGFSQLDMVIDKIKRLETEKGIAPYELEVLDGDTMEKYSGEEFLTMHENIAEAPVNIPDYKSDDMSYVKGVYKLDKRGSKYQDRYPGIDLGKIPGLKLPHELIKDENGNIQLYHTVDPYEDEKTFQDKLKNIGKKMVQDPRLSRKPLGFVSVRPFKDGYIGNSVATDPNVRAQGIASKLLMALAKHLNKPFYFGRQTSPDGKRFTKSIIKQLDNDFRVVGYSQLQQKEFEIDDIDELYQDIPDFSDDPYSADPDAARKALRKTPLIKLIPESFIDPKVALRELLKEATRMQAKTGMEVAQIIASLFKDREVGIKLAKRFLDVVWDLNLTNIQDRRLLSDPMAMTPYKYRKVQPPKRKTYTDIDREAVEDFVKKHNLPIKIHNLRVDVTRPAEDYNKNIILFDIEIDYRNSALQEQADSYLDLKGLAELIFRTTGDRELARNFFFGNNRLEFNHEDDVGTSTSLYTVADALEDDRDIVNDWLQDHNISQFKIHRVFLNDQSEPYFELDQLNVNDKSIN